MRHALIHVTKKLAYEASNATFGKLNLALLSHHPLLDFG
jgi:hypothetical protein